MRHAASVVAVVVVLVVVLVAACKPPHAATTPHGVVDDRAAAAVGAFTNDSPHLTGDGHVVFVSNRDGLPQLYVGEVDHPERAPVRLQTPPERVAAPSVMPDGKTIVFLSDLGSDQKFHVYRIGVDGKNLVDLTPTGDTRRGSLHVARETGLLVYTGHVLEDQTTHVYIQALDGAPREIYQEASVGFVADFTADGSRVLFVRAISDHASVVLAIDTATGDAKRLYPPEGQEAAIGDASFSADGASAVIGVLERALPPRVVRIDAATGAEQARYVEATATTGVVESIAVSPDAKAAVVAIGAGDHTELRVLDARSLALVATPAVPLGELDLEPFTPDSAHVPLTLRATAGTADDAMLDVATGTLSRLRDEPRPGLGTPPRASIEHLRAFDGKPLPVNLYLPAAATGRLPTLVLVHGGPSGSGRITWSATIGFWSAMCSAVIAPIIRGSTGFGIEYMEADDRERRGDAVKDIATVNAWARAQPWCDGDRLVIGGISYGGYMTLLALTRQPTLWSAGIDGSGMSNLRTMEQLEDQTIRSFDDTEFGVLGKDDMLLAEWSPITAVERIVAPVFVYQGVRDPVTPQREADQIVEALRARHVPVEYMLLTNEGHGITRRENMIAYFTRSYRFLAAHLKLAGH